MEYKIAFVIGTRAELIKCFPLMLELNKQKIDYYFIHTGQHSLKELCECFSIKTPDLVLTEEPDKSSKFNTKRIKALFWNLLVILKIKKALKNIGGLKYVLYHGDTMTTASAAIASSRLLNPFKKYKSVHLEGGLRSFNIHEPFPEEISRKVSDYFSDIILAVSKNSMNNLGSRKGVYLTGNTILDSVDIASKIADKKYSNASKSNKEKFALVTIHRHENIKNRERLSNIVEIISSMEIKTYFMLHDNTEKQLYNFGFMERIMKNKNIILTEPEDYISFINNMKKCSIILCDGGSMQEESLIFKKPCIILRKFTERQEGLETNFQFLSKLNVEKTKEKIKEYLSPSFKIDTFNNPYGEKGVSKKIMEVLKWTQ